MRQINKFHHHDLAENFENLQEFLKQSIDNLRSSICKNTLTLFVELYSNDKIMKEMKFRDQLLSLVRVTLNSLLTRTTYDKVFIAKEAKKAVTCLMENAALFEVLEVLDKDGCHNKLNNKPLIEASHTTYLDVFLKNIGPEFTFDAD